MRARASGHAPDQLFFTFVTQQDQVALTEHWHSHIQRVETTEHRRDASKLEKLRLQIIRGDTLPIDCRQFRDILDLPLGAHAESELDVQPEPQAEATSGLSVIGREADDLPEKYDWSESDIRRLHEGLLEYSLNLLKTRGNAEEKYDILRWIWAPDVFCYVTRSVAGENKHVPILRKQLPFTFVTCCTLAGYDADRLRSGLAYALRDVLKRLGIPTSMTE